MAETQIKQEDLVETAEANNAIAAITQWSSTQLAKWLNAVNVLQQQVAVLNQQLVICHAELDKNRKQLEDYKRANNSMQEHAIRQEEDLVVARTNVKALQRQLDTLTSPQECIARTNAFPVGL